MSFSEKRETEYPELNTIDMFMKNTFYYSQQEFKTSFLWEIDLMEFERLVELTNLTILFEETFMKCSLLLLLCCFS